MRVPGHQRESYTWTRTAALAGLAVLVMALAMALVLTPSTEVRAASVTTLASATLSADTQAVAPGSGVYTSLTGPVIAEAAAAEVGLGTIILTAPPDFEFRTTGTVTVSVSPTTNGTKIDTDAGCGSADDSEPANLAATTITITVCTVSSTASTITWSGIGVRPTGTGATLPPFDPDADSTCGPGNSKAFPTGDITVSTSTISGIPSGTALGHLAETSGAPHTIQVTTHLAASSTVNTIEGPLTVCVEDQFGSGAVGAPVSWSISSVPAGATCQALIAPDGTTDGTGQASTWLRLGHLDGSYQVRASSGAAGSATDSAQATGGPGASCVAPATSTPTPGTPTATPTGTPTPTGSPTPTPTNSLTPTPTTTAMESVALAGGTCNPVASTYPDATAIATIAGAVAPSSILTSIWWFDAFALTWHGYSAQAPQASNLNQVDRLDAFSICVSSAGAWSRPKI